MFETAKALYSRKRFKHMFNTAGALYSRSRFKNIFIADPPHQMIFMFIFTHPPT